MKTTDSRVASQSQSNEEETCDLTSTGRPSVPPGIVGTTIEEDGQSIVIDYDPRAISDESVSEAAARLAPELQRRFDKCVMRLGGHACEACALKLESKAQKIEGVRRARATFIGGVMSVTFDNAQLSPDQVIEQVRKTGAPVTPFTIPPELPRSIGEWLKFHSARIEAACTVSTFVFMIAGWFAPRIGLSQNWASAFFTAGLSHWRNIWRKSQPPIVAAMDDRCRSTDDTCRARCSGGRCTVRGSDAAVSVFALKCFAGLRNRSHA